jgi:hypothetical protein
VSFAAHAGVQGKSIGLGDAFQSGIRPVEWAEGPIITLVSKSLKKADFPMLVTL